MTYLLVAAIPIYKANDDWGTRLADHMSLLNWRDYLPPLTDGGELGQQ